MSWNCVPLSSLHDRKSFESGVPELDEYLRVRAGQDQKRGFASVYVAVYGAEERTEICGYYTLSAAAVLLEDLPEPLKAKMPRYPSVPAVRLGRLAVARTHRGRGLGEHLLFNAVRRSISVSIGWVLFIVDAKDENARRFYLHFGFTPFPNEERKLYLRRSDIEKDVEFTK